MHAKVNAPGITEMFTNNSGNGTEYTWIPCHVSQHIIAIITYAGLTRMYEIRHGYTVGPIYK